MSIELGVTGFCPAAKIMRKMGMKSEKELAQQK